LVRATKYWQQENYKKLRHLFGKKFKNGTYIVQYFLFLYILQIQKNVTMKKIILSIAFLAITFIGFAQKNPLKRAEKELGSGQLDLAKASIEEAMTNEKSKDEQSLWLVRGNIYRNLFKKGDETAFDEAAKCLTKYAKMLKPTSYEKYLADTTIGNFSREVLNIGANAYDAKDWQKAMKNFERVESLAPADTTAMYYYLAAASNEDAAKIDKDKFIAKGSDLIATPFTQDVKWVYRLIISFLLEKDATDASGKAMAMLDKAVARYPQAPEFMGQKVDYYIKTGKQQEAINGLEAMAAKGGENVEIYYLNIGILYEQIKNTEKAEIAYKKSIELKPDYFDGLRSLSALYVNKDDVYKSYNAMDMKTSNSPAGKKIKDDLTNLHILAMPYLVKAISVIEKTPDYKQNTDYGQLLNTLKNAYTLTGDKAKEQEIKTKLDELYK
jgi:tetratricopeptide (TPR) repeat protein